MKRWHLLASIMLVVGLAGAVDLHPARAESSDFVNIQAGGYSPSVLTVDVGSDVSWINFDSVDHTATSDTGAWDTGTIAGEQSVNGIPITSGSDSIVFNNPGTFPYHDRFNSSIHGTIVVQSQDVAPSPTSLPPTVIPTSLATPIPTASPSPTSTSTAVPTATATSTPTLTFTPLKLQLVSSGKLRVGRASTVRVSVQESAGGALEAGATVSLDGRKTGIKSIVRRTTNTSGVAVFKAVRPRSVGIIRIAATKAGFVGGSVTVRVQP
jgi:plastocyanin